MADYKKLWGDALTTIHETLTKAGKESEFNDWFRPVVYESFDSATHRLLLQVPSSSHSEYIEKNHIRLLARTLLPLFGKDLKLGYRVTVDSSNNITVVEGQQREMVNARKRVAQKTAALPDVDPQLDPHLNFRTFIEGDSNKLSRSVGINIAEHPKTTKFNPMFIFGQSGVGKTHLINAVGVRAKELYPTLRVLYVSARLFQQQYTTAVQNNAVNDFIAFYQTLDMLIVDDIQEWASAVATQNTFFHIFDFLFRHGKRLVLASDRSPAQLRGMHERLITRFACGVTIELEKPNTQLCRDILRSKISRDGLAAAIPDSVVQYIAETVHGSVRDLQGVLNSLMVYSIVDNAEIDVVLAEKIVKRVVQVSDEPITLDLIVDTVCERMKLTPQDVNGKSRKKAAVLARQIVMYLAQKLTSLSAARIGRLLGGRDHTTVIHSCRKVERELLRDDKIEDIVSELTKEVKARAADDN